MLDYRIHTFLTLCETMNYRIAAAQLNMTQPSVTQHIQSLEKYYGCKLFEYNGRHLSMTPQAAILKKYANSMNYQEQKLLEALTVKKGVSILLGATKTIGEYVISKQIANFLKNPDNQISIEIDNTERILEQLDRGKLDFALIEGFFDKSLYASKLYRIEPFVGFCSSFHPLANKEVSISELLNYDLIIREAGSGTRNILEQLLTEHNYSIKNFKRTICINQFGLLESLVAQKCGITFAYEAAGRNHPALSTFTVKEWTASREFNYVYLPGTEAQKLVELFQSYES